jgi:hypothetical protein
MVNLNLNYLIVKLQIYKNKKHGPDLIAISTHCTCRIPKEKTVL